MSDEESYSESIFHEIGLYYQDNIYVNITIPICLVGMILNLLNVLVFTRKTMNSPPNLIFAHLAFVDFIVLLTRTVQFWMDFIRPKKDLDYEDYTLTLVYWYNHISIGTFQFISAFLTVQLAAWRYIAVVHPLKERNWCTKKITRNVVIIGYVICCVLYTLPEFLSYDIEPLIRYGKTYYIATPDRHPIIYSIKSIVFGLLAKILPSFVLAGFTTRIVVTLLARKPHREQLSPSARTRRGMKNVETRQKTNRSTAILLAVAALFFIAEFPKGILWLLLTINRHDWDTCYESLLWILLTITHINISFTFMVYYTLSQQFRTTFKSLFNLKKRTTSYQTHTPLALVDTQETESGRETSEV